MLKTGELIKQLRKEKGITQAQLAEQFGCTQHAVSQWETGKRVLDEQTFQAVLDFLGISMPSSRSGKSETIILRC